MTQTGAFPTSRVVIVAAALAAALLPISPAWVEETYARGIYPRLQPALTSLSSVLPIALLDAGVALLLIAFVVTVVRAWRERGARRGWLRALGWLTTAFAVIYLLFLASWGLNYRRPPLVARLDFDTSRISEDAAFKLAAHAIREVNSGYPAAHAQPFRPEVLDDSLATVQLLLGSPRPARPARAKRSLAQLYFRQAAIDGMTVPVFLEVILHPDLTAVETPFVLGHEQAHIAGFADESEASFVAWLACVRSVDPVARYSGWLDAYRHAANGLSRSARANLPRLDDGPREDLRAISARLTRSSPVVRTAAREVYDSYLKANRIEEGIQNYGRVLQLVLGTRFDAGWRPSVR